MLELEIDEEREMVGCARRIRDGLVFSAWFDDGVQAFPSVVYTL